MGEVKVTNFGQNGVDVVRSPEHLDDADITSGQNAAFITDKGLGGLGSRAGFARLNSVALAGSPGGFINVPLPPPGTPALFAALEVPTAGGPYNTWSRSANDGVTWASQTTPAKSAQGIYLGTTMAPLSPSQHIASIRGRIYYAGSHVPYPTASNTEPPIRVYDGTTDFELTRIPPNPTLNVNSVCILNLHVHRNQLFCSTWDDGAGPGKGRVFLVDTTTGTLTQIGERFGTASDELDGIPWCFASLGSRLYLGTHDVVGASVGRVYWIRPGVDDAWTLDHTTVAGNGCIVSMAGYRGKLYIGVIADAGLKAMVRVRNNPDSYAMSDEGVAATTGYDWYDALIVYSDALYAARFHRDGTPTYVIRKFDGTTWTTDYDVQANYANRSTIGQSFVFNSRLYMVIPQINQTGAAPVTTTGIILKKASGAWAGVGAEWLRGYIGAVRVVT